MLDIRIETIGAVTVVHVAGEMSELDVERLTDVLGDVAYGENARVAIELSGLKLIDSSGLSALITVVTRSRMTQGRVVLVSPSPFVSGILNVTRLDGWFDIRPTLEEARKLLG